MADAEEYRAGATSVLWAGQALLNAVEIGDEVDVQAAVAELLRAAKARESPGGAVQGFLPSALTADTTALSDGDEMLAQVLTELNVGQALMAAAGVTGEGGARSDTVLLSDTLDSLQDAAERMTRRRDPGTASFVDRKPAPAGSPLELFREHVPRATDAIVARTVAIGKDVVTGLIAIPASAAAPVIVGAAALAPALPDVGSLVQSGVRALERALRALEQLVPAALVEQLRQWAREWWEQRADSFLDRVARALLAADELDPVVAAAFARSGLADERLRTGYHRLVELDRQHERVTDTLRRIVRALARILGPVAALLAAAAAWLYGVGVLGYMLALGCAVWVGRDYLGTGRLIEVVPGIRTIVEEATS